MPTNPVFCVGAAHWDVLARAEATLAPGADVPGRIDRRPGGVAANIAIGLAARHVPVALIAAIGQDAEGDALVAALAGSGVDCGHLLRPDTATDCYLAIETTRGDLHAAVADCRALEHAGPALIEALRPTLDAPCDVVLDGNLPAGTLSEIVTGRARIPARIALVAASPAKAERLRPAFGHGAVTLYANRREAEALCDTRFGDSATAAGTLIRQGMGAALITDGASPAAWADLGGTLSLSPPPIALNSVTGAGDLLVAAHLAARRAGLDPAAALKAGLAAATAHAGGAAA